MIAEAFGKCLDRYPVQLDGRSKRRIARLNTASRMFVACSAMDHSGVIWLKGDVIHYQWPFGSWEMSRSDLLLIGEATSADGPYVDDYWLCFASGSTRWYEASFYAAGLDDFLSELAGVLGQPLTLNLFGSANCASRVLWPSGFVGNPMFKYEDLWPSNRMARAIVKLLGGPFRNVQTYTDEVRQFLEGARPKQA